METKIKAVIFDMFETLVSLFIGRTYFGEDIGADAGVDPEAFRKVWQESEHDRTVGKLTVEEGIAKGLETFGINSPDLVKTIASHRLDNLKDTFDNTPDDTETLLKELHKRGIKIGLITNTFSDERDMIRASKLFKYFDATRISYEQGVCKPDPSMYKSIMEEFGVKPEECLYVGDGGSRELFVARELGMKPVQATWFHHLAFEPHIPRPLLPDGFPQGKNQLDILEYI